MTNSLRWSAIAAADTPRWAELSDLLAVADGTEEFYSAEDLAEELAEPGFDPERDSWAVWDGALLVGYGQLRIGAELAENRFAQAYLDGGVHTGYRGRGIGVRLMDLMEARARELAADRHPGAPLRLRVPGRPGEDPVRPLVERRGYRVARYFTDMHRDLPGAPLAPVDPGVTMYQPQWAEPLRSAHNAAFAGHWGSTPQSAAGWRDRLASRTFRPATSALWLDGNDVLAYALTYQWVDGELYFGQIGTRPEARGRGLARACITAALQRAVDLSTFDSADLSVDSANPTGAGALYESVGFTAVRTMAIYLRDEAPPA
ncbi:MAG: hypothetical protein BGO26_13590 [Actinobacteria bacterium 69-20]|nr:GNAT family N-acetyltransferase [Actinomycetota bacterium]OJV27618.1 MAG: hypothetical protein BGO26_13590 [Actinobacteria bacterium 69-20]